MEDDSKAVFGYGSLIFPGSIASRFIDVKDEMDKIYDDQRRLGDKITIERSMDLWDELDRINLLPVKITGFRRVFGYRSPRGGGMLSAIETGEEDDFINGVLITGLTSEEVEQISGPEEDYLIEKLDGSEFEYYTEDSWSGDVVFYAEGEENFEKDSLTMNMTYQDRIMIGIKMMKDRHGQELAENFFEDYLDSTYVINEDGDQVALADSEYLVSRYRNYLEDD